MARTTVELQYGHGAVIRQAIVESPRTVGLLHAIEGRNVVGLVVEEPDVEVAPAPDELVPDAPNAVVDPALVPSAKPRRRRGKR